MNIRCVVSCRDANGVPTFYPCEVDCSRRQYEDGEHYEAAAELADDQGYDDVGVVYDENDGPAFLFEHYFGEEAINETCDDDFDPEIEEQFDSD